MTRAGLKLKGKSSTPQEVKIVPDGRVVVCTGAMYKLAGSGDKIVAQIDIKGCTIKNDSADGEHRFSITTPAGIKHVFKVRTANDLREWLLDLEAVFTGVHAPKPQRVRLHVSHDGLKVLPVNSDKILFHWSVLVEAKKTARI